jgi:hypothetical protein
MTTQAGHHAPLCRSDLWSLIGGKLHRCDRFHLEVDMHEPPGSGGPAGEHLDGSAHGSRPSLEHQRVMHWTGSLQRLESAPAEDRESWPRVSSPSQDRFLALVDGGSPRREQLLLQHLTEEVHLLLPYLLGNFAIASRIVPSSAPAHAP